MPGRKLNVVMTLLHQFALESTRRKAIEIIANAQRYNDEDRGNEDKMDIELIRKSANEFLAEIENAAFTSSDIEILIYRGKISDIL
ncbi:TPA: hypothetical protein QDB15_005697 [Burkholderia vietnamiensis]|nr:MULTISPECIES: hypothetical protein [Burkholderia]MCA8211594.1 hypothetical protein [Burkholderia vietnamiensis]HDR9121840.1 hypothetical protein [Burkholderia vietnamiensis]HDR9170504.1 hypothetical protein [Burkholderia vietnamiensis]